MIVLAIPSARKGGLNDLMDSRFGRCHSFTVVTLEDKEILEVKVIPNPAYEEMGGSGVLASQIVHDSGANEVIVEDLGPNAINSLISFNLKAYHVSGNNLTVKDAIDLYIDGKIELLDSANISGGGMGPRMD